MNKFGMKKFAGPLLAAILLVSAGAASAATASQSIALNGTLTPPPASCAFSGSPSITFSGATGAKTIDSSTIWINVNCTSGTMFAISSQSSWSTSVTVGGVAAGARLMDEFNADLFSTPMNGAGTGADAPFKVRARLGGVAANSNLNPAQHVGAVSGTVNVVVTY